MSAETRAELRHLIRWMGHQALECSMVSVRCYRHSGPWWLKFWWPRSRWWHSEGLWWSLQSERWRDMCKELEESLAEMATKETNE